MKRKACRFGFCLWVLLVGALLWFLFAAPPSSARGRHQTVTPTKPWTPVVVTIVPGPTIILPTATPLPCSRSYCP